MVVNFCERKNPATGVDEICAHFRKVGEYVWCQAWGCGQCLIAHDQCHCTYKQMWIPKPLKTPKPLEEPKVESKPEPDLKPPEGAANAS